MPAAPTRQYRLLVADDEEGLTRLLCRRLAEAGFEVAGVWSGAEALAAAADPGPLLLLLDYELGDMKGPEVIEQLAARGHKVPFIVMTGRGDEQVAVEMMKLGARDYVVKEVGFVDRLIATVRNVERSLRVEDELQERERRLADAHRLGGIGYWDWDVAGRTLVWSDELHRIFGVGPDEPLTFETIEGYIHPEDRPENRREVERLFAGADHAVWEFRIMRPDGAVRYLVQQAEVTRDRSGTPTRIVGTMQDITDRKRVEQELERHRLGLEALVAERTRELQAAQERLVRETRLAALGRVAGAIAHEIRNPLGSIRNAAYYLRTHCPELPAGRPTRHLAIIEEEVLRADRAITRLLDFARGRPANPSPEPLAELIPAALARAELPRQVELECRVEPDLPPVLGDREQLEIALANIIRNAGQAMCERAETAGPLCHRLRVAARRNGESALIEIADTGPGMPPEILARAFEPLFSTRPVGVGLGLAIARVHIEANQGGFRLESEPGRGTTAFISLPLARPG